MEIIKKFNDLCRKLINAKIVEERAIVNKTEKKLFKNIHKFLKHKSKLPYYHELLEYEEIKSEFSPEDLEIITLHLINKIHGIFKHAQSEKTKLCNAYIITSIKLNRFTICITKNTLEANEQWTKRAISDLKKAFPNLALKELILVCSSSINTIGNNATHCKNVESVIAKLAQHNTFRVLFICSNETRINDTLTLLSAYSGLSEEKQLKIHIQWDEAHNLEQGIPSKRQLIENIIMNPIVEQLTPCTATPSPLYDDNNPLWVKANLEKNAIDYTNMSKIKSTSPEYSSLGDATPVSFEDIKTYPSYTEYGISEFDLADFNKVDNFNYTPLRKKHENSCREAGDDDETIVKKVEKLVQLDKDRRRKLEFNSFMKYEMLAYNMALNMLDNFYIDPKTSTPIFKPNEQNFHIMATPKRNVFTYSLMKYAIGKPYSPILFGLYRGKINVMYKDNANQTMEIEYGAFSENGSTKEFNEKIEEILNYLEKTLKINTEVPIIFMGSYIPTGESITFVNYKYGTLRSVILFQSTSSTPATDYQSLCRLNYMTTKFIEHDEKFTPPPKFICGYKVQIDDALIEEKAMMTALMNLKRIKSKKKRY
jgi:hypothetical protein